MADRKTITNLIDQACKAGARQEKACQVLGIPARTIQRWRKAPDRDDGRKAAGERREPANKLCEQERFNIEKICNQSAFSDMSPNQIVPALADQGIYVASESSFYRVLRAADQLAHRGKAKAASRKRPQPLEATGPNQLWSWDITYLRTTVKGLFFYLYMIMDVYSRKIVGWEVCKTESAEYASELFRKTYLREGIAGRVLFLHSDNGSPMKGATMLATLEKLGVLPSFSRPSVSNDNPYSEALFKTLKYHPGFPEKPFDIIEEAREWVAWFQYWYNEVHHHSALKFVTPGQRHRGEDIDILRKRKQLYDTQRSLRPERWSGATRNWTADKVVSLNPNKSMPKVGFSKPQAPQPGVYLSITTSGVIDQ
jgi:putative transposase